MTDLSITNIPGGSGGGIPFEQSGDARRKI